MIRLLRTFLWFRVRVAMNAFRRGERRDALETVSQAAVTAVGVVIALVLIPISLGLGIFGALAGYYTAQVPESAPVWLFGLRIVFVIPLIGIVIGPFVQGPQGFEVLTRFVLLPVSRRTLVFLDLTAHLADFWVLMFVPALLSFPVGIAAAGRPAAALATAAASILYLAALGGTGALLTRGVQIVFRERRRRELLSVVVMVAISSIGMLPLLFDLPARQESSKELPAWAEAVPSDLVAGTADSALRGHPSGVGGRLAILAALSVALYAGAGAAFRRSIEDTGSVARRTSGPFPEGRPGRAPRGRSPIAAVARAQSGTILRSVRGKVIVLGTPVVFLVVGAVFPMEFSEAARSFQGPTFLVVGAFFAAISLQPVALNQFTADGPGLARLLLAPLTPLDVVRGKAAGLFAVAAAMTLLMVPAAVVVPGRAEAMTWVAAAGAALAGHATLIPVQSFLASIFPTRVDLNQFGRRGGNAHPLGSIVASMVASAAFGFPALAGWLASASLGTAAAAAIAWGCAAAAAGACLLLLPIAAKALEARQDNVLLVASGR